MKLTQARKTLGQAIGMCPKDKLFKGYIDLEVKLFEFSRCRTLYEKYIAYNPANSEAWKAFAELERGLDDIDRARAIFELAVSQEMLDMPELVWKEFIDFEADEGEYERARALYERLLDRTSHVKVWISYALFEINVPDDEDEGDENDEEEEKPISDEAKSRARSVFERAYKIMKEKELKEDVSFKISALRFGSLLTYVDQRVALLNAWKAFETTHGSAEDMKKVEALMPSRVKKRRKLDDDTFEEYMDWLFPQDDEGGAKISNLLQMAHKWRQEQAKQSAAV
jgi:crooked neck